MNSNGLVKMGSRSIVYVGKYALIYLHTIVGERIVSRDGLPRDVRHFENRKILSGP